MEFTTYFQFFIALAIVLGLIALCAWAARRFGLAGAIPLKRGQTRRLAVIEAMAIDSKHRLVLVKRDDKEHLILIGGGSDLVVEGDIPAAADTNTAVPAKSGPDA